MPNKLEIGMKTSDYSWKAFTHKQEPSVTVSEVFANSLVLIIMQRIFKVRPQISSTWWLLLWCLMKETYQSWFVVHYNSLIGQFWIRCLCWPLASCISVECMLGSWLLRYILKRRCWRVNKERNSNGGITSEWFHISSAVLSFQEDKYPLYRPAKQNMDGS